VSLRIDIDGQITEVPDGGACTVGRKGADLCPDDVTLSRAHFRISHEDGEWRLEDLGSASGTWLDGAQVRRPTALKDGARIRAGRTTFTVQLD